MNAVIDELFEIWKMAHVEEDEPESDEKKTYIQKRNSCPGCTGWCSHDNGMLRLG